MELVILLLFEVYDLVLEVFSVNGFSVDYVVVIVCNVIVGECDGCVFYGLWWLLGIVDILCKGKVLFDVELQIYDQVLGIVWVDVGGVFLLLVYECVLLLLLEKVCYNGIVVLVINCCVYFFVLFVDIELLIEVGLVGLVCMLSYVWVVLVGGICLLFGINFIVFGWLWWDKLLFIVDMVISVVVCGEIQLYQCVGKVLLEGWGIDSQGQLMIDVVEVLNGVMLIFGGYKGLVLVVMVELLVGLFIGDMISVELLVWDNGVGGFFYGGELILVLDLQCFFGVQVLEQLVCVEMLFMGMQE